MLNFVDIIHVGDVEISIRHVSIATDLPLLERMVSQEFPSLLRKGIPPENLLELYTQITLSPNAGAYIACIGEDCLFLFEAHNAKFYDIPWTPTIQPGDWVIEIFAERHPLMAQAIYVEAIKACIQQCFRQPSVTRLLVPVNYGEHYDWIKGLLFAAGFVHWREGSIAAAHEFLYLPRGPY